MPWIHFYISNKKSGVRKLRSEEARGGRLREQGEIVKIIYAWIHFYISNKKSVVHKLRSEEYTKLEGLVD